MHLEQKQPYKVYLAGDRRFPVCLEYDEQADESYPAYPDFEERPEYTGKGSVGTGELPSLQVQGSGAAAPRRARRLRLVSPGTDALRPHRRLHVQIKMADGTISSLTSGATFAGLQVPEDAVLAIGGAGKLTANGGAGGAGIGGGVAGIGGTITISGGTVAANGIGGGIGKSNGDITIRGGTIEANGGNYSAGIGGGYYGSDGTLQNNSTDKTPVFLTTVTLETVNAVSTVSSLTTDASYIYGISDMQTDDEGRLYLYLPENTLSSAASAGTVVYKAVSGEIKTEAGGSAEGVLYLDAAPAVGSVTLSGTGAAVSGSLAITFDKTMSTTPGTVTLNGSALSSGSWQDARTYSFPYSGLDYSTSYTVGISGFQDVLDNIMTPDNSRGFTTETRPPYDCVTTYYTITASAGAGGSISPSGSTSVASGNSKTYTITANKGYKIGDVLVDGVSVGVVSAYTFENVRETHAIAASFRIINPFADVASTDWFYDNVLYVYRAGLMTSAAANIFSPHTGMTRAMTVTVLCRLSGDTGNYTNGFLDIGSGSWYENAAAWAVANGIANGTGGSKFDPDSAVTREQLAVMLYNYAKYKGYDISVGEDTNILSYGDALSISDYACAALQWACNAGILNGDTNGNLNPHASATRAEVVAMLQRFVENVAG